MTASTITIDQLREFVRQLDNEVTRLEDYNYQLINENAQLHADKRKLVEAVASLAEELCDARAAAKVE